MDVKIRGQKVHSLSELKEALRAQAIEEILYPIYMTQPLANVQHAREILSGYVQELFQVKKKIGKTNEEQAVAKGLSSLIEYLSAQTLEGNFVIERDKVAEEISRRIENITGPSNRAYATGFFPEYLRRARRAYNSKLEKIKKPAIPSTH